MDMNEAIKIGKIAAKVLVDFAKSVNAMPIEDYWYSISLDWDLNIWFDEVNNRQAATIYPVVNGQITDDFIGVWHE